MPALKTEAMRAHGIGVSLRDEDVFDIEKWHEGGSSLRLQLAEESRLRFLEEIRHFGTMQKLRMWQLSTAILGGAFILLVVFGKVR